MTSELREREDEWKMTSLGGRVAVRLTIPLLSADHVQDAAAVFRALADTLSETAASDAKTMHKLFDARWAIMSAQRCLKGGRAHFRGAR
jgi:hypothetical protein